LMKMTRCPASAHSPFLAKNCRSHMYHGQGGVCLRGDAPAPKSIPPTVPQDVPQNLRFLRLACARTFSGQK
jgi:hypothetical protein